MKVMNGYKRFVLGLLLFGVSNSGLANPLPTPEETESILKSEICYDLTVNVVRLVDRTAYNVRTMPLCLSVPERVAGECILDPEYSEGWVCPVSFPNGEVGFFDVVTPRYEFRTEVRAIPDTMNGWRNHHLYTDLDFDVVDVWDYRFSKILAANAQIFPIEFSTILLQSLPSTLKIRIRGSILQRGDQPQYTFEDLGQLQGIGYDDQGAEYAIRGKLVPTP